MKRSEKQNKRMSKRERKLVEIMSGVIVGLIETSCIHEARIVYNVGYATALTLKHEGEGEAAQLMTHLVAHHVINSCDDRVWK